ncbi:unnamed protein product [Mytilus coruscus]|uniref:Integrase zinc-binding domain-containing protein n=1 Tax=Mytilus coruscus TaxID=42192 RepID=A0A6J7ZUV0_MYTCO|nr:unnamed protein product [Mytilus coruscus]
MPPPSNKAELQTILGMVNYLSKFAPNLAEITSPMRAILNKDVEFAWDEPQIMAFKKVKEVLTRSPGPILSYYDPTKDLTLQVDASKYGLGAVVLQDDKPVAYASKSLSTSEINYSQIEKEILPISDRKLEEIEKATLSDPQFDISKSVILEGWPQSRSECPTQILEFWNHRDELSVNSSIIFKRYVIPTSLRALMLDKIHTGHMGVEKYIRRARDVLFWPKMSSDISDMVLKCSVCLERRTSNARK